MSGSGSAFELAGFLYLLLCGVDLKSKVACAVVVPYGSYSAYSTHRGTPPGDSFGKCDKPDAPKSCSWVRDSSRAVDYFGFTRLTWSKVRLLEFAIGRPAYDNWLVSKAALAGTPVISATEVMRALHQNHNYKHITAAAASAESQITGKNYELFMNPLADYNRRIIAFKEKEGLLVVRGDQRFNTFKMRQARKDCKATKYVSHGCGYQVARVHPNPRLKKYLPKLTAPPFHCKKPHLCLTHVMLPTGT